MPALHRFRPRILDACRGYSAERFGPDLAAGLTVGIVALPLAMAFAIASGLPPQVGLVTAVVAGFLTSLLGGSNVQIGGPAGAFIVVVYGILERHGLANLLIATAASGVLLFALGWLRLGGLIRFIPLSIVIGFTNGIAVLIGLSQLKDLLGLTIERMPADFFSQIGALWAAREGFNPWALAIALASLAIVVLWPKSYRMPMLIGALHPVLDRTRRVVAHLPGTVIAMVAASLAVLVFSLPVETIGSRFGRIPSGLPMPTLPEFSWLGIKQLTMPILTLTLLGAIESLLCARVADNMASGLPKHDPNQELMAQGIVNVASPLFGGMPATGTIARTATNVRSGAKTPVAGIVHALALLAAMLVAAPLALAVPLPALAGILLFVAWNMGEWREFARLRQFRWSYRAILLGTFFLTVVFDLTVAVEVGLVMACVFFIWRMASLFSITWAEPQAPGAPLPPHVGVARLYGSLFFGAVDKLEDFAQAIPDGTEHLVLDLSRLISMDTTGLDALKGLHRTLQARGATLWLVCVNAQPRSLIERAGFLHELGEARVQRSVEDALAALRTALPQPSRPA